MPTYSYQCKSCGHFFEEVHKIDDRHGPCENACPNCQEKSVQMILGAPAFMDVMKTTVGTAKHKPTDEFREVMKKIKKNNAPSVKKNIKDY